MANQGPRSGLTHLARIEKLASHAFCILYFEDKVEKQSNLFANQAQGLEEIHRLMKEGQLLGEVSRLFKAMESAGVPMPPDSNSEWARAVHAYEEFFGISETVN